ncbi:hypothetical protein ACJRO7_022163 [Eucalyptus globulus]|uniref:TIR domain-containing protein n=1 Tax=Eucalyptus globulus TaxID=34317 RepID=A0ABD3KMA3_EUCGL
MSGRPLYDVFLSFRGRDTRKTFTDCLYNALKKTGIRVYRDKEEMERGEEINEQLMEAIKQSKISIPVISKNYANSKSCLRELAQMLEYKEKMNHIIIPIFYYVNPSNVRNCSGPFKDLAGLKKRSTDGALINSWKTALGRIGHLTGHHLDKNTELSDGEVINQIVDQVQRKLKKDLIVTKELVEVTPHVQEIMAQLKVDYHNGQAVKIGNTRGMVLIHGISGVGKTELAKCIYNKLHHLYHACSFVEYIQANIECNGILSVQNKLIYDLQKGNKFHGSNEALTYIKYRLCDMKVLVLLDDVKDYVQLRKLIGEPEWFGPGSRVIVTSHRDDLLKNISGAESFFLRPMEQVEALKLFCRHAFGTDSPNKKFKTLSTDIVTASGRLPLTLKLVGSHLEGAKQKIWQETLEELQAAPHESVRKALEKSYNNLKKYEQQIFLDIACFFTGNDRRIPSYMWDDYKYSPDTSIQALQTRSLVEIGDDKELCMHELLKNFGREMVKKENKKPFKRSRLCDHNQALKVLQRGEGTSKVQGLRLDFGDESKGNISFDCHHFDGLKNLRFLKLDWAYIQGHFGNRLSGLRWLDWQACTKSFDSQPLNLNLQNLVILDLSGSQVDKEWRGWELLVVAKKLKVLKLSGCVQLSATPKFPPSMELERLFLEGCSKLALIHRSFGNLKKLVSLNMEGCSLIRELPDLGSMIELKELVIDGTSISRIDFREGSMRKLKILSARDCKNLTKITDSIKYLKSLKCLALDDTAIPTLPKSIESLENLKTLSLKNCKALTHLPEGMGMLTSLQFLDLSCTYIRELPPSVNNLKALKVLRMSRTFIEEFPEDILNLEKLEEIDFSSCGSLKGRIHCDISRLSSLAILNLSKTHISGLPQSLFRLSHLQRLDISRCGNLKSLPELPSGLIIRDDN